MKYKTAILGGTFDRFHAGHEKFLQYAFSIAEKVIVGITSNAYVSSHKTNDLQSYDVRRKFLEQFFSTQDLLDRVEIHEIHDEFGPSLQRDVSIDVIVVTTSTVDGAKKINDERTNLGLTSLAIELVPLLEDEEGIISSTRIRSDGKDLDLIHFPLVLGPKTRAILHEPLGTVSTSLSAWLDQYLGDLGRLVTVGDMTTEKANILKLNQDISVVDLFVERKRKYDTLSDLGFDGSEKVFEIKNPAGTLQKEVFACIDKELSTLNDRRIVILIDGEEDLLVIPLISILPIGHTILYGQPRSGVVVCQITEELKRKIRDIMGHFEE